MPPEEPHVWLTNKEFRELRDDVRSVKQSLDETVKPNLQDLKTRVTSLELRVYAILAGLVAAFSIGKGIGLI